MRKILLVMVFACALFLICAHPISAATINVNTTDDELTNNGNCTLREAIQAANTNLPVDLCGAGMAQPIVDTINIPFGTFYLNPLLVGLSDDNTAGDFDIFDSVSLVGSGVNNTVIDGNDIDRIFDVHIPDYDGGFVSFSKMTVTDGKSLSYYPNTFSGSVTNLVEDGGGGIRCGRGATHYTYSPNLTHDINLQCKFSEMEISQNTTDGLGAGVLCGGRNDQGSFNMNGHVGGPNCIFDKVTIFGNTHSPTASAANKIGGAGVACVNDSTFQTNSSCKFINTTISENGDQNFTYVGGGILCINNTLDLSYSTIVKNVAQNAGGIGIQKKYSSAAIDYIGCPMTIIGSIIDNGASTDLNCQVGINTTSSGYNLEASNQCGLTQPNDKVNTPSLLEDRAYHSPSEVSTHRPMSSSQVIEGGASSVCVDTSGSNISTDSRGVGRPKDSNNDNVSVCEIGAHEVEQVDLAVTVIDSPDPVYINNTLNLIITLSNLSDENAYDVELSNIFPISHLNSPPNIVPSSGYCNYNSPNISCFFEEVAANSNVSITISATTLLTGNISQTFDISSTSSLDIDTSNNSTIVYTSITNPPTGSPLLSPTSTTAISPTRTPTPAITSCPSNTTPLFTDLGVLSVGQNLSLGGVITNLSGTWTVIDQNNVRIAENGINMVVSFPSQVLLDRVLIYDNDPKAGENPWSINTISLPITANNTWGPPFLIQISTNQMSFDNGGDSPHFNICLSNTTGVTPTITPTGSILTPTPPNLSNGWWLAKNTSLQLNQMSDTNVAVPTPLANCGTETCLLEEDTGLLTVDNSLTLPNFVTPSQNKWVKFSHTPTNLFKNEDAFFEYMKSRPNIVTIADYNLEFLNGSLSDKKIYLINGNINWASNPTSLPGGGLVVLVDGDLNISSKIESDIVFISSGKITFSKNLSETKGIFIAKSIAFSDGVSALAENHLEIVGNVFAFTKSDGYEYRNANIPTPPIKIIYDINQVMKFLDKVSIKNTISQ